MYLTERPGLLEEAGLQQALSERLGQPVDLLVLNRASLWLQFRVPGEANSSTAATSRLAFASASTSRSAGSAAVDRERVDGLLALLQDYVSLL